MGRRANTGLGAIFWSLFALVLLLQIMLAGVLLVGIGALGFPLEKIPYEDAELFDSCVQLIGGGGRAIAGCLCLSIAALVAMGSVGAKRSRSWAGARE